MTDRTRALVLVAPHGRALAETRGCSTRPARLAAALAATGSEVVVITRTAPWRTLRARARVGWPWRPWPAFEARHAPAGITLIEHPMPPGTAEHLVVRHILRAVGRPIRAIIVLDPRSASVLAWPLPWPSVFDAYDAWDLSPLFLGRPSAIRAIHRGYAAAAAHANLVTANTQFMADRMRALGASRVELLPNGAPAPLGSAPGGRNVVYVGNVQPRLRGDPVRAAGDAAASVGGQLCIAGAMQEAPHDWAETLRHEAIAYLGPLHGPALDAELGAAAVGIVPHRVDDYTRSQDAMKAWDYLAAGLSVVSTSIPPATSVPGLARIADDPESFGIEVATALADHDEAAVRARLDLAARNSWAHRAEELIRLVDALS